MSSSETTISHPGIAQLIEDGIRRTPDRIAVGVADGSTRLTYRQLRQLARTLARHLEDTGINRTDTIALYCDNRPEYVVALLAAWAVGAAVAPIDPWLTAAEVHTRAVLSTTCSGTRLPGENDLVHGGAHRPPDPSRPRRHRIPVRQPSRPAVHPQLQRSARPGHLAQDRRTVRRADDRRLRDGQDRARSRWQARSSTVERHVPAPW